VVEALESSVARIDTMFSDQPEIRVAIQNQIGTIFHWIGKYESAEELYTAALKTSREIQEGSNLDVAQSLNNMGMLMMDSTHDWDAATAYFEEALDMEREIGAGESLITAETLHSMGVNIYRQGGDMGESVKLLREALAIRRRLLGGSHPDLTKSLNNLAGILQKKGEYEESEVLLREAIEINRGLYDGKHFQHLLSLRFLGYVYWEKKDYDSAEPYFLESLELSRELLAEDSPLIGASVNTLIELYDEWGKPDKAAEYRNMYRSMNAGPDYGLATGTFPIDQARGKRVRYSGFIKTEEVSEGYAGLWWRVHGEQGKIVAFDNMGERGAVGTTGWHEYVIELDVPDNPRAIYFGVLHAGQGTAWFDHLHIELDGTAWMEPSRDLDFESEAPAGFTLGGRGYEIVTDQDMIYHGKGSLRSRYVGTGDESSS
jgi:Tfp pilus assembly protein PilF